MEITLEDFMERCESNAGYCVNCHDFTQDSGVEPDAREYECPDCGERTMMGAEEALIENNLEIVH